MKISSEPKLVSLIHSADEARKILITSGKSKEASQLNEIIESNWILVFRNRTN